MILICANYSKQQLFMKCVKMLTFMNCFGVFAQCIAMRWLIYSLQGIEQCKQNTNEKVQSVSDGCCLSRNSRFHHPEYKINSVTIKFSKLRYY